MIRRRRFLHVSAASLAISALPGAASSPGAEEPQRTSLGLVTYCCRLQREALKRQGAERDLFEPMAFLEHCRRVGAGGMQADLGVCDERDATALRKRAEASGMFIEAIVRAPQSEADRERFDAEMQTAHWAGALAARTTIIPGRRYEFFDSLERFRDYAARGRRSLELAAPIAERRRVPLAVENHKDQRNDERVDLLRRIGSEYVGACVDTGNSFALLEDPIETVERLAPWAFSVHLKDQAVCEYEEGFLLADIPLGEGFFDLKRMVAILRRHKPDVRFSLELITRDPLQVPCLMDKYWATMPDVPGRDLARTLRMVRANAADSLPEVDSLPLAEQAAQEESNVRKSLDYAREHLGL